MVACLKFLMSLKKMVLVVSCAQCEIFQAQSEKKGSKWTCRLCGEKQSFRRVYGSFSAAKDARVKVQAIISSIAIKPKYI